MTTEAIMADGEARDTETIGEVDARIEEQLSIICSIDAQMADRSAAVRSGDLDHGAFVAWAVRAADRRAFAASDLVALRHRRHRLTHDDERVSTRLRKRIAQLVAQVEALTARVAKADEAARERMADTAAARDATFAAMPENDARKQLRHALSRVEVLRTEVTRLTAAARRPDAYRDSIWREMLEGETAVIRPERAFYYLARTRNGVPAEFRDAFCAAQEAAGYPCPRTAAECAAMGAEVESRAREGES